MDYSYELKIPKERVGVLIGIKAKIKRQIEQATKTNLDIDSKEGDITITGEDGLGMLTAQEIVKAVGRGFNPDIALQLLKQDFSIEIISLQEYLGKNRNKMLRLKGRIIGQDGSTRHVIEELTRTSICVYGKTVGIIGQVESVQTARRAIESLLTGSPHAPVYRWLEKKARELRKRMRDERVLSSGESLIAKDLIKTEEDKQTDRKKPRKDKDKNKNDQKGKK